MTTTNTTSRIPAVSVDSTMAGEATALNLNHGQLILAFADGSKASLATVDLTPEVLSMALLHGLKQKLVDAAAIARNTDTGQSASVADKKQAVLAVLERLMAGEWNKGRESGDSAAKGSILFLALTRMQPTRDQEELQTWLKARTDAERAALMKNPKVLPFVQAIQSERAATAAKKSGVDSDALLSDLLGE